MKSIKFQYISDLHLEFNQNTEYLNNYPLNVTGDYLIIAGDAILLKNKEHTFWDWCSKNYKEVFICYGNHEFYHGPDLSEFKTGSILELRPNVKYYYNCVINIEGIDIIISPLWAYIHDKNKEFVVSSINDFKCIKYNGHNLTSEDFNKEHEKCLSFIKDALKNSKAKYKIVVTHHLPSNILNNPQYYNSPYNEGFVVELQDYIKTCGADYWIFGHSHYNSNKIIGNTQCLSNQIGYVMTNEHKTFDHSKYIELKI